MKIGKTYELLAHVPWSAPKGNDGQPLQNPTLSERAAHGGWLPLRLKHQDRHLPTTPPPRVEVLGRPTPSPQTSPQTVAPAKHHGAGALEAAQGQAAHSATFSAALQGMTARHGIGAQDLASLEKNRKKPVAEGVVRLFVAHNDYTQTNGEGGICTAASFAWAKQRMQGPVGSFSEVGNAHLLFIRQITLQGMDDRPREQTELAGLVRSGGDRDVDTMRQVIDLGYAHPNQAVVFWAANHTMAFWSDGNNAEFFDNERGCFFAQDRESIERQMNLSAVTDPPIGARVVRLPE